MDQSDPAFRSIPGLPFSDPEDAEFLIEDGVRRLQPGQKKNLRYHIAAGTPILAGDAAWDWSDGCGGICVAMAASSKGVPVIPLGSGAAAEDVLHGAPEALRTLGGARFLGAVKVLTQEKVVEAITRGLT
jgi:hypothetical protein